MKWRPIKTAPKDRLILLACWENYEDYYVCVGRWIDVPHTNEVSWLLSGDSRLSSGIKTLEDLSRDAKQKARWVDGYPGIVRGFTGGAEYQSYEMRGGVLFRPTHWMPLPNPPVRHPKI